MEPVAYWIWPKTCTCTQNKDDPIWHALMTTRSLPKNNQDNVDKTLLLDDLFICAFTLSEEELADDTKWTLLPDYLFLNTLDLGLWNQIISSTNRDCIVSDALTALQTNGTPPNEVCPVRLATWGWHCILQGYMLHTQWHWIAMRDSKTIQHDYWWPGMHTFMKNFVDRCAACQQAKINWHPIDPPLMPIKGSTTGWPFAQVSYDFITNLPVSDGFDSLMVMVDHRLLKGVILCPCHKTINATGTAELFIQNVYQRFDLPDKGISDKGSQFALKVFKEMGHLLGIELAMSTAYHPQTDGATKQLNQEIEAYLAIFCANNPE